MDGVYCLAGIAAEGRDELLASGSDGTLASIGRALNSIGWALNSIGCA